MPWWGWTIIGLLLFSAELIAIDAHFYLIFIGASAIAVGAAGFLGVEMPIWVQWLTFAALSVIFMFTLRQQLYERMRPRAVGMDTIIGTSLVLDRDLEPGMSCRTDYQGSTWTAINIGSQPIPAGSPARIEGIDGITLRVSTITQ
jgi:membrane protein implicated in regulation of membrane protease activity